MKLFSRNAEQLLNEKVASIDGNHSSWRCVYINFANDQSRIDKSMQARVVTAVVKELLENNDGFIYLCEDGDVFILFQGQAAPILQSLGSHLSNLNISSDAAYSKDEQYILFDLNQHWRFFLEACRLKLVKKPEPKILQPVVPEKITLPEPNVNSFNLVANKRSSRKKLTVLIVEDDPFTRRLVSGILKNDFDITEAGSGIAAIEAYESYAPDIVFLDIELPDVNGHILLNKFIKLDKAAFVVMLSANSVKENIIGALEKGAQGFIAKPFSKEKLLHYLHVCENARKINPTTLGSGLWS